MLSKISSASWLILVLVASIVLAVECDNTQPSDVYDNSGTKSEVSAIKRPFFVGSRYGRSQYYGPKAMRQVNVAPRNDRFFLGSRYGKRSQELTPDVIEQDSTSDLNGVIFYMSCSYTGVSNLYRCNGKDNSSTDHYTSDDTDDQ